MGKNIGVITEQGFVEGKGLGFRPVSQQRGEKEKDWRKERQQRK